MMGYSGVLIREGIEVEDRSSIGRVVIGNNAYCLVWLGGSDGFLESRKSWNSASVVSDMVSSDGVPLGRDEQEGISVFAVDFDIGFIPGAEIIDRSFKGAVKAVAVI